MNYSLKPGDKLYLVPRNSRGTPQWVIVEKVGRKWAQLNSHWGRISLETLAVDGGDYTSPAQCYLSEQDYQEERDLAWLWGTVRNAVEDAYHRPPHLNKYAMEMILSLLKEPSVQADAGQTDINGIKIGGTTDD